MRNVMQSDALHRREYRVNVPSLRFVQHWCTTFLRDRHRHGGMMVLSDRGGIDSSRDQERRACC